MAGQGQPGLVPIIGLSNRGQEQVCIIFRLLTHDLKTERCGKRERGKTREQ